MGVGFACCEMLAAVWTKVQISRGNRTYILLAKYQLESRCFYSTGVMT